MAGTAMSPHTKRKQKQAPMTLKNISGERAIGRGGGGGGGAEEDGLKKFCAMADAAQRKISMPLYHMKVVQE